MAFKTRKELQGFRVNMGSGSQYCPGGPAVLGILVANMNGPTAAEKLLDGGMLAGPRRFFQFLAEEACQNSSSHGQPILLTSPIDIVPGRFNRLGN
jgi:hypothetical protein